MMRSGFESDYYEDKIADRRRFFTADFSRVLTPKRDGDSAISGGFAIGGDRQFCLPIVIAQKVRGARYFHKIAWQRG